MNPSPNFDPHDWKTSLIPKPRHAFDALNAADAESWQHEARAKFAARLGAFPEHAAPLNAQVLAREEFEDYSRETVTFQSFDGLTVFAYLLKPLHAATPSPALICLHGHGDGVNPLVGLDKNGEPQSTPDYHNDFALQAVRRGYVVLAPEILGFGRRQEPSADAHGGCQTLSGAALMIGQTIAGWRVYEAMRALDYLQTQSDVDVQRIGATGISGGGLIALFLAALDSRVRATVVSGYLNTFRDSVMNIYHCIDNFVPGLALDLEMTDIAALVAPRALWCEQGDADDIFPVEVFRSATQQVTRIYEVLGASQNFGCEVFQGDHHFHGEGAWPFLEQQL